MNTSTYIGTLTQKGQITVPANIRAHLQALPNDKLTFTVQANGDVLIKKPQTLSLDDVFGIVPPRTQPEDFQTMRNNAMAEHFGKN